MEYFSTDKAYVQYRKDTYPLFLKAYKQVHYPQLRPNSSMLHVLLDIQVLVLITWGKYICMKKKNQHHNLLCKGCL